MSYEKCMKNKIRRRKCGGNSEFGLGPRKTTKIFDRDILWQLTSWHSGTRYLTTLYMCVCVCVGGELY